MLFSVQISQNARLFFAASCTCNDSSLCKSYSISSPTSRKRLKLCKVFNAFVSFIEIDITTGQGASYFSPTSLFQNLFLGLSKPDISCLNFSPWVFAELRTCCCLNDFEKKKEEISEKSFVDIVINIRMREMNSMINSKTSFKSLR